MLLAQKEKILWTKKEKNSCDKKKEVLLH